MLVASAGLVTFALRACTHNKDLAIRNSATPPSLPSVTKEPEAGFSISEHHDPQKADLEIPFLGRIPVKQERRMVKFASDRPQQEWIFSWTLGGSFLQADFVREGFQVPIEPYTGQEVHESSGEKILSFVDTAPSFKFEKISTLIDGYCEEQPIDKVSVRRVSMSSPVYGEKGRELYLVRIWSKGVYPVKRFEGPHNDYVRVVLDDSGKELGGDNGE